MRILILSLAIGTTSIACGGSTVDSPVGATDTGSSDTLTTNDTGSVTDTGSAADAATDSGSSDTGSDADAAAACTTLTLGPSVTVMAVAEAAQPLKAGTIIDGTYVLTSATDYTGPGGATGPRTTLQRTVRFNAGKFEFVRKDMGGPIEMGSGTFAIKDGRYDQHLTCPEDRKVFGADYEATPTTVKMFIAGDGISLRLAVMTKM